MRRLPLAYTAASLLSRWPSALVAIAGIAGSVAVFVAMLAIARGFEATLAATGSPGNALVRRAGASSEMDSSIGLRQLRTIEDAPGVARHGALSLVSPEVVANVALPLRATGGDANVQVRGVGPRVLEVRDGVRLLEGRMLRPGLAEVVAGRNARLTYSGIDLGQEVRFGGVVWTVVGILDGGGSAFDSELWCEADLLKQAFSRPREDVQSVTVRLESPGAFEAFARHLASQPGLNVQVEREVDFYRRQSQQVSGLILGLGTLIASVMGVGAVFGALNTLYSALASRRREIATLRAVGFGEGAVVISFLVEALLLAVAGGVLGGLLALPLDGFTAGTLNWQTFSHVAFAFRVAPDLLAAGMGFALLVGVAGGLPPALRAARLPVAEALRDDG